MKVSAKMWGLKALSVPFAVFISFAWAGWSVVLGGVAAFTADVNHEVNTTNCERRGGSPSGSKAIAAVLDRTAIAWTIVGAAAILLSIAIVAAVVGRRARMRNCSRTLARLLLFLLAILVIWTAKAGNSARSIANYLNRAPNIYCPSYLKDEIINGFKRLPLVTTSGCIILAVAVFGMAFPLVFVLSDGTAPGEAAPGALNVIDVRDKEPGAAVQQPEAPSPHVSEQASGIDLARSGTSSPHASVAVSLKAPPPHAPAPPPHAPPPPPPPHAPPPPPHAPPPPPHAPPLPPPPYASAAVSDEEPPDFSQPPSTWAGSGGAQSTLGARSGQPAGQGSTGTGTTTLGLSLPNTLQQPDLKTRLECALDNMLDAQPREPFMGRWELVRERDHGGQAVVAFARDNLSSLMECAIKFFLVPAEFEEEVALYRNSDLAKALPDLMHASGNSNGADRSRSGFVFPPYIIMERGVTLTKWMASHDRGLGEVATMVDCVGKLLAGLHAAGLVHRDVKPANTLYLLHSTRWRLLDVGIVARDGEKLFPRCTLAYASPEVITAYINEVDVIVSPAHDVWALGVMAYEALVGHRAIESTTELFACAALTQPYPWDAARLASAPTRWRKSRLRPCIAACLAHDPAQRPAAADVVARLERLWVQTSV